MSEAQSRLFSSLRGTLSDHPKNISLIPSLVAQVIERKVWRNEEDSDGVPFSSFQHMLEYRHPWGFNTSLQSLLGIINIAKKEKELREDCVKCEQLLFDAVAPIGEHGSNQHGGLDNINSSGSGGTSRAYTILKLQRDAPELADSVLNGEISASEAAVKMGYRKVKTPYEQLEKWWGKASPTERKKFKYNHFRKEEGNA